MSSHAELRLVVLGRTGAGKRSAVCAILGLDSEQDADGPGPQESRKHRGQAAGRQVAVVSGPPWFGSGCDPQQRRRHLSALVALSSPGPHAFLLCVPVNRPADEEAEALAVLGRLFGASAVSKHTVVLFTHTEELEEDEQLDDYLAAWRHDLQELLQRCGGRHHTLEARAGAPGAGAPGAGAPGAGAPGAAAVEELLQKVERALQESGEPHLRCLLYQQTEQRVREKQVELARSKAGGAAPEELPEQLLEEVRDEAERSVGDLDLDVDAIFPSGAAGPAPSLARRLWGLLTGWTQWLPTLVRRESLLGALVGLFVGGPFGGVVGATVGSVATEVGRRKTEKTK